MRALGQYCYRWARKMRGWNRGTLPQSGVKTKGLCTSVFSSPLATSRTYAHGTWGLCSLHSPWISRNELVPQSTRKPSRSLTLVVRAQEHMVYSFCQKHVQRTWGRVDVGEPTVAHSLDQRPEMLVCLKQVIEQWAVEWCSELTKERIFGELHDHSACGESRALPQSLI